jgi:hypothetical protein
MECANIRWLLIELERKFLSPRRKDANLQARFHAKTFAKRRESLSLCPSLEHRILSAVLAHETQFTKLSTSRRDSVQ